VESWVTIMDPVCKSPCSNACVLSQNLPPNNAYIQIRRHTPNACMKGITKRRQEWKI
jgi:hypothetical protein